MKIIIDEFYELGIFSEFSNIKSIEFSSSIGKGGFGEVFLCDQINQKNIPNNVPKQAIKILKDDPPGQAKNGYNTIKGLINKLSNENKSIMQKNSKTLIDDYPSLYACPQFCFIGKDSNQKIVYGYSTNYLEPPDYIFLADLYNDTKYPSEKSNFNKERVEVKIKLAYDLTRTFDLLNKQYYIHADLKPEALFINMKENKIVLIDYDSGAIMQNPNDSPTTPGTPQSWLAPEIFKQLSSNNTKKKVNLLSDIWSVACAIFCLIFFPIPDHYFFMNDSTFDMMKEYFKIYRWPDVDTNYKDLEYNNYSNAYSIFIKEFNRIDKELQDFFIATFNEGYFEVGLRTSYKQWIFAFNRILNNTSLTSLQTPISSSGISTKVNTNTQSITTHPVFPPPQKPPIQVLTKQPNGVFTFFDKNKELIELSGIGFGFLSTILNIDITSLHETMLVYVPFIAPTLAIIMSNFFKGDKIKKIILIFIFYTFIFILDQIFNKEIVEKGILFLFNSAFFLSLFNTIIWIITEKLKP